MGLGDDMERAVWLGWLVLGGVLKDESVLEGSSWVGGLGVLVIYGDRHCFVSR